MFHLLQWSKDQGDDDEKPAILHSFLKSSDSVLDLSSLLVIQCHLGRSPIGFSHPVIPIQIFA